MWSQQARFIVRLFTESDGVKGTKVKANDLTVKRTTNDIKTEPIVSKQIATNYITSKQTTT